MDKYKVGDKMFTTNNVKVVSIDEEKKTIDAIFSTQGVDRHGDVVVQDGWDLKNFKKNPVILDSHNYWSASEVIGKAKNVRLENKKLVGTIVFAVDENPKAKVIFDLFKGGYLSAFSVGFMVKKFKELKDGNFDYSTIEESELLEVSAVSVPANAQALAKAKGIDVDLLLTKENEDENKKTNTEDESDDKKQKISEDPKDEKDNEKGITKDSDDNGEQKKEIKEELKEVKKVKHKTNIVNIIKNMELKRVENLNKVKNIIDSILEKDNDSRLEVGSQIKKRKINQAIRTLIKVK